MKENTPLNRSILKHFYNINRLMRRQIEELAHEVQDLTFLQIQALIQVKAYKKIMVSQLAHELHISLASASILADKLVSSGWLSREHDAQDRRVTYLTLTPDSKANLTRLLNRKLEKMEHILHSFPEGELNHLEQTLTMLENKMTQHVMVPAKGGK
jgi:DNA-binding MarR family transcriptional regulator